jgi:outer membrane immunogenic protein
VRHSLCGWLATPNLLLFGTGGFAYGRVAGSANYISQNSFTIASGPIATACLTNVTCFAGSSSTTRTGWTAGGGIEYLLDQHWSAKVEYQFVDLGTETVRLVSIPVAGLLPATFNAAFRDSFNVVRLGLNYKFW